MEIKGNFDKGIKSINCRAQAFTTFSNTERGGGKWKTTRRLFYGGGNNSVGIWVWWLTRVSSYVEEVLVLRWFPLCPFSIRKGG